MGKDLKGKNLGKGIGQRKDGRYEARAVINGVKVHLWNRTPDHIQAVRRHRSYQKGL